ncbi:MAG: DCC1-like thiol-disulfide oxidoreductase family protein [Gemmatimonadota bacterium]
MTTLAEGVPVLLFDGTCGLCHGFVRFLLQRDQRKTMRLATLEGPIGVELLARHPELKGVDSVVWVLRGGRGAAGQEIALAKSDGALAALAYLGFPWSLLAVTRIVPRFIRDRVYDFVARNRYQWFGRYDSCPLPTPEDRARYL